MRTSKRVNGLRIDALPAELEFAVLGPPGVPPAAPRHYGPLVALDLEMRVEVLRLVERAALHNPLD